MARPAVVVMAIALLCAPAWAGPEQGLVAQWDFDEGKGDVLHDRSGNGNHGKIHGATWVKAGNGYGLRFARSGSYVDFGKSSKLKIPGDVTITAWVKLTASPYPDAKTNWVILTSEAYDGKPMPQSGFILRIAGDSSQLYFRSSQPGACQDSTLAWPLQNNRPYLVGIVKRGGGAKLLLNGLPGPEFPVKDPAPGSAPLLIGGTGQSFNGIIGDVRIYNRALSNEELMALYKRTAAGWAAGDVNTRPGPDTNIALSANGCWVVASSNANWTDLYCSNLVDGNRETVWQSFQPTREEWVELKWDFEMAVSRVSALERSDSRASDMELLAWVQDEWQPVTKKELSRRDSSDEPIEFQFPTLRTKRLRLICRNDEPRPTALREIQVFGPEQPLLYIDNGPDLWHSAWAYVPPARREQLEKHRQALAEGRVSPLYTGKEETVVVEKVAFAPGLAKPGSDVTLTLRLKPTENLSDDYILVTTVGEREHLYYHADYTVTRTILAPKERLSLWQAGQRRTMQESLYLPVYAPHGEIDVMLHGISPAGRPPLRFVDATGAVLKDGKIARLSIRRFPTPAEPDPQTHSMKIDTSNGTVLSIDGRRVVPFLFTLAKPSFEQFHYYSKVMGTRVFQLQIYPLGINAGDYRQRNYDFVAQHIRNLMRIDPEAFVIIEFDMRTRGDWQEAFPQGCLYGHDGKKAHESFCAREYREEALGYIEGLLRFVQSQPWANRVIGYTCEIGEPEGTLSGRPRVGDYNPQAIEAFREFVRARYADDVERLRRAYGAPQLTFARVYPVHEKIMEAGAHGGCFLDPTTQRLTIDYHEFLASLIPTFLNKKCGAMIKRLTGGRALVGTYGAYLPTSLAVDASTHQANHHYTHYLLGATHVDFFASPHNYLPYVRHSGGPYRPNQPYDAIRINGKLHISECDQRTFRAGVRAGYGDRSREETYAVLTRDLGTALMHGTGAWLADWSGNYSKDPSRNEPFFLDKEILEHIGALYRAYEETLDLDRGLDAEAAVFMSGPSAFYLDNHALPPTLSLCHVVNALHTTGVPYDELIFEDVLKSEVRDHYKCFIFLNCFYMTEEQRAAVEDLKRDGKTLVWLYAPGYVRDSGLATRNIEELTGFRVGADHSTQVLSYRLSGAAHPITRDCERKEYRGHGGVVSPRFYIADLPPSAKALGVYADGKIAAAAKEFGSYRSVYFCVPYLSTPMLANLLRYAGCHAHVNDEIYMDATRNFLMLTNTFDGKRDISVSLPRRCDVSDLLTGNPVAADANQFSVQLAPGEARLYRLK